MELFKDKWTNLILYVSLLFARKAIYKITFLKNVRLQINNEKKILVKDISNSTIKNDQEYYFYCYLILVQSVERIRGAKESFIFRRASFKEYRQAKIYPKFKDKNGERTWYYFYETYEYKFTLLLNFTRGTGVVLHLARHSDDGLAIKSALNVASNTAKSIFG